MSALALCLCDLERKLFGGLENEEDFSRKASYLARLGSGSACRSIYPLAAVWGATSDLPGSSDLFALPYGDQLHQVFRSYQNAILIVGKGEKSISSRTGHHLMDDNEYAESRYQQARRRMSRMLGALSAGDLESFGAVVESEALTLHALMMASYPPYILLKPNTITLIEKVRQFRLDTKTPLYFSLDAGPNPHLLYPENEKSKVETFIENELKPYCEDQRWIADRVGEGPQKM
jgi:diphosphomevalonate decarboxylase